MTSSAISTLTGWIDPGQLMALADATVDRATVTRSEGTDLVLGMPVRLGLGFGLWMGLYQIARGEHFLSHTLATAALAWWVCVGLVHCIRPQPDGPQA